MNWEAMAMLAFGLCPGSALLGLLAGVVLLRALGARWPWEREAANAPPPNGNHRRAFRRDYKTIRVQAAHLIDRTYAEESKGWVYAGTRENAPGLFDITFFREINHLGGQT